MKDKIMNLLKSKVVKNSMWLTILQIMNTVIPMLTIPYITRVLGAEKYGVFSLALNWILYFQVIVEFGFGLTGARKVALIKDKKELQKLFNNIISARIILFSISFALLNIISIISGFDISTYICMLLLNVMILGTTFQLTWLFQGKQDMKFITIISSVSRIISVILVFLFVKTPSDIYLYCLLYSITLFLSSMISLCVARKKYNLKFKFANISDIKLEINDGKYLFYSAAMSKIFSGIGTTVLGFVAAKNIIGIYSAIYKIPYILNMFFSPISQSLYPHNSIKLKEDLNSGRKHLIKIVLPIFVFFSSCSLIIVIFRKFIINLLFGDEYINYSLIIIPFVIQFIFAMMNNFMGVQFLVASNNQKRYSKAFSIGCIVIVILNIVLGYFFNIYGVAVASMVGEMILSVLLYNQTQIVIKGEEKNGK